MASSKSHLLSSTRWGRAWVVALVAVAVCGRVVFLLLPVSSDTAMFVYAGKLVAEGGRPGVDLLDNKLPSVGLLMSVPFRLFGAHWNAYAAIGLSLSIVASWFLYRVVRDVCSRPAAMVTAVTAAVWLNFPAAVYGQLQLETIEVALASVAGAGVLRALRSADARDAFVAGLCGGLAMWAKPTGGAVLAAGASVFAFEVIAGGMRASSSVQRPAGAETRCLIALAGGAALPMIVCVAAVYLTGMAGALPETLRQLRDYSAQSTLNAMDFAKPLMVLGLLGFPILVLASVYRRDGRITPVLSGELGFVTSWLLAELAGVILQRRMYAYHFLVLGPPAAVLTGLVARRVSATSLTLAFGPAVALSAWMTLAAVTARPVESREDRVIAYLEQHTTVADTIWADDYPRLLVETGRRPGSRVPLIFLMANGDRAPDFFGQQIECDWAARRPAYIAFAKDPARLAELYRHHMADVAASPARADAIERQLAGLQAFLQQHYRAEVEIDGVVLWRRRPPVARDSVAAVN